MSAPETLLECDTLIVGAGLLGSGLAMAMARMGAGSGTRVVDFDLEGSLSSSELNAGGVRATWNQPLNIEAAKLSIEYFASVAEEVGYRACGYLWLQTPERMPRALEARARQRAMGWEVEAWDVAELRRRVPFIDKTDDLAGATFGVRDGLINPNTLKLHYRAQARAGGVAFDDRTLVRGAEFGAGGATVAAARFPAALGPDAKLAALGGGAGEAPTVRYRAKRVVNCAGPWAGEVARRLGYATPARAVRRQVCIFDCRDVDLSRYGMIVDPSGVYSHPEAMNGLAGIALPEAEGFNFAYDGESFFMEHIWPALYERSTKFERLKHLTGWGGLYEVSPDESAIVGEVEGLDAARRGRLWDCHSFSGHGVMHSYAVPRALAERMVRGRSETLDIAPLAGGRFARGQELRETAVI
jgi:glycine/D-amino acid oxidase-like deaminating enzyme